MCAQDSLAVSFESCITWVFSTILHLILYWLLLNGTTSGIPITWAHILVLVAYTLSGNTSNRLSSQKVHTVDNQNDNRVSWLVENLRLFVKKFPRGCHPVYTVHDTMT